MEDSPKPETGAVQIEFNSIWRQVLRGGVFVGGCRVAGVGLAFLTNMLLAWMLSPAEYGVFLLLQSFVMLGALVGRWGNDQAVVRFVSEALGSRNYRAAADVVRLGFRSTTVSLLPTVIVLSWILWNYVLPADINFRVLLCVGSVATIVLFAYQQLAAMSLHGFNRPGWATAFNATASGPILSACFLVLLVAQSLFFEITLAGVIFVYVLSSASALLLALGFRNRSIATSGFPSGNSDSVRVSSLLSVAVPIGASMVCTYCLMQGSLWIAWICCGEEQVAWYGLATRVAQLIAMVSVITTASTSQWIGRLNVTGQIRELQRVLRRSSTLAAALIFCVCLPMMVFPEVLLTTLFGAEYVAGANVLRLLALGRLLTSWTGDGNSVLQLSGYQRQNLACSAVAMVLLFAVGFPLTAQYGIEGLAAVTASTMVLCGLTRWLLAKRLAGVWTHPQVSVLKVLRAHRHATEANQAASAATEVQTIRPRNRIPETMNHAPTK